MPQVSHAVGGEPGPCHVHQLLRATSPFPIPEQFGYAEMINIRTAFSITVYK